jgi:hypothetical protein
VPESEYKKYVNRWNFYDAGQVGNTYEIVMLKKKVKQDMPIQVGCSLFDYHVQRVSAKHGVKDDFAFLWEHAIFRHPPNKNPLTDRSEILHN